MAYAHFLLVVALVGLAPAAWAQQPSQLPAVAPAGTPLEIIGQRYGVIMRSGKQFAGTLRATTATELTFDTDVVTLTLLRDNILKIRQLTSGEQYRARQDFEDVGNGTHMFTMATARNLRRGEGYLQDVDVLLASVNYGFTDHFSLSLLVPLYPVQGVIAAISPKVSTPLTDKVSVGAGVFYAFARVGSQNYRASLGLGYGVVTYGTASSNLTLGLGYGSSNDRLNDAPVAMLGGNLRLTRNVFLVNETYLTDPFGDKSGPYIDFYTDIYGLTGVRIAGGRVSGSVAALYTRGFIFPVYFEFAYRFGKPKPRKQPGQ